MNSTMTFIPTKLSQPVLSQPVLVRTALVQKLTESVNKRLTLLAAGAGYGKTHLVSLFAQTWPQPVVWYTVDQYDGDEITFAHHLTAGLKMAYPEFNWEFPERFTSLTRQQIISCLINQIQTITHPVVIVLDNFQEIEDESTTLAFIDLLLSYAPAQLRFIINSHKMPRLGQLSRLRSRGECVVFAGTDLRFTKSEIQDLHTLFTDANLSDTIAEQIEAYSLGWPLSVNLKLRMFSQKPDEALNANEVEQQLTECVTNELAQHPARVRNFLRDTTVFDQFSLTLAGEAVLGYEDAPALIAYLQRHNLFISAVANHDELYTYPRQIRQLLQQNLLIENRTRYIDLHQRAARYFEQNGQLHEALSHYQWAENHEAAMHILENLAEEMLNNQHLEKLRGWLKCVAPKSQLAHPKFLLYRARLQARTGQPNEALALLGEAQRVLSQDHHPRYEMMLLAQMGLIYVQQGDYASASRLLQQALHGASSDTLPPADLNLLISSLMAVSENVSTAVDIAQKALYQYELQGDLFGQAQTMIHLAGLAVDQGQMPQAQTLLAQSAQIIEQLGSPAYLKIMHITLAARRFWLAGDLAHAEQILEDGAALLHDSSISPLFSIKFRQMQANVTRDQGRWSQAESQVQATFDIAVKRQAWALKPDIIKTAAWLKLHQNDLAEAQQLAHQAQNLTIAENVRQSAQVRVLLGVLAHQGGRYQEALLHLETAQNIFAAQEATLELYGTRFHLTQTYFDLGYEEQAVASLSQALAFARENEVAGGYFWMPQLVARLCVVAIAKDVEARYATCLAAKLVNILTVDDLSILIRSDEAPHRLAALHLLKAMDTDEAQRQLQTLTLPNPNEPLTVGSTQSGEQALPNIRIYCLGNLRVERNAQAIEGSAWAGKSKAGRQKVKTLLAYLVERGKQGATKDELVEALWGSKAWGRDEARLESSLARTLSALRQVLEPDLLPPATSSFIINEEGRYYLNTSLCWIDGERFQDLIKEARVAKSRNDHIAAEAAYAEAKALYRGEYFRDISGAEEWAGLQRYALSQQLGIALMSLGGYHFETGAINDALTCYREAIEQEPTNHTAHYMLIDALRQDGRLEDAVLAYQHCRKIFDQEVDEEPPATITELYETIQKQLVRTHSQTSSVRHQKAGRVAQARVAIAG